MDDSDHVTQFFMSPTGYDRVSSSAPCAAYLIKIIPEDSKTPALSCHNIEESTVKFAVAMLGYELCAILSCCRVATLLFAMSNMT